MGSLADEILEVRSRMDAIDQSIEATARKVQDEATTKILGLIKEGEKTKKHLALRLLHLEAAYSSEEVTEQPKPTPTPKSLTSFEPKKPAGEMILIALASNGPMPSAKVDNVVIEGGWSKAAADKAKMVLKKSGLATSEKRVWKITDAGKSKVSGI